MPSVASSALTVTHAGGTVDFRSGTASSGAVVTKSFGPLSLTVPSTATMGQTNAVAARLWVAVIDPGGTPELAICNTQTGGGQIFAVNESSLISTTVLDTAADNAGVWYSATARASVAFRLVGYIESTQAAAGTWATAPSVIQGMGPGVHKPGDVVQQAATFVGTFTTDTTQIPATNAAPTSSQGAQYLTQSITPTSAVNALRITAQWIGASNAAAGTILTAALLQDVTVNALKAAFATSAGSGYVVVLNLYHQMVAGTASSTALKVRAGANAVGTTTFNGSGGAQLMGGVADSYIQVAELMA
jgi:hypothetical protein